MKYLKTIHRLISDWFRAATEEYMSSHFFICRDEFNEIWLMARGAEQVNYPRSKTYFVG